CRRHLAAVGAAGFPAREVAVPQVGAWRAEASVAVPALAQAAPIVARRTASMIPTPRTENTLATMKPALGMRALRPTIALAAVAVALLCADVSSVSADAADPILASTTGTVVVNPDGSRTVTVHGGWQWTTHRSNCNNDKR